MTRRALGVFVLWFGRYGFNAGSTLGSVGADIAFPAVTTTLAACAGTMGAMIAAWTIVGQPDIGFTLNRVLAGLVGITAGTADISFSGSVLVGLIAGVIMVFSVILLERIGIDDPVGAISVHGTAGIWGVVAVALFSEAAPLSAQLLGVAAIFVWTFGISYLVFKLVDMLIGIRVSPEKEFEGFDRSEHGGAAYPEFLFQEQVADRKALDPVGGA